MFTIDGISARTRLGLVEQLLLVGEDFVLPEHWDRDYNAMLSEAKKTWDDELLPLLPDNLENDKIWSAIFHYVSLVEAAYFDIGLRCGAQLTVDLMKRPALDPDLKP